MPRPSSPGVHLAPTNYLTLTMTLSLRNSKAVEAFLHQLYDPASPGFHRYLKPQAFAERFGPSAADYQKVLEFARGSGFAVTGTHAGRMVVEANASAGDVEKAFGVRLLSYSHPNGKRRFFAPDAEPSVPADVPVVEISGLNNYAEPCACSAGLLPLEATPQPRPKDSSGPGGTFGASDLRLAYMDGVLADGTGQSVGLLEFDTCYVADIRTYEKLAHFPEVTLEQVRLPGTRSTPGPGNIEVALDVEMAQAMAPGLSRILLYEAPLQEQSYESCFNRLLIRMAEDDAASQLSCSWNPPSGPSVLRDQVFQQMAAQGQSFFQASGDDGAYAEGVYQRADNPYVTVVGGTGLRLEWWGISGGGIETNYLVYSGETVWNERGSNNVTGGGISTNYPLPSWQQGMDMSANGGSTSWRNSPDVAMAAYNIYVRAGNGKQGRVSGTSAAAPLWAGFTALVNQQAASHGLPSVGFLNPALYAIGQSAHYGACFHDVVSGDNTTAASPTQFYAAPGYDLCTGWGSPAGQHLLDALTVGRALLTITPTSGFSANGPVGGPFNIGEQSFTLANSGWTPVHWTAGNIPPWLEVSPSSGTILKDESVVVMVSLNAAATNLGPGSYSAAVLVTNLTDGTIQSVGFALQVWQFGGLQVQLSPDAAVQAAAHWRVDGGAWQNSGNVVSGLQPVQHTVEFSQIANWSNPSPQSLGLLGGQTNLLTCVYTQQFGALTVTLVPPDVAIGAAKWRVDGGPWQKSGDTVSGLLPTNHMVSFSTLAGWRTPAPRTVLLEGTQTTTNTAVYAEVYQFTPIAGQAGVSGSSDGTNSSARFASPNGLAARLKSPKLVEHSAR